MTRRNIDRGAIVTGVILLTSGVVLLLGRFTGYDFRELVREFWPMIFVVIGLPKVVRYETLWSGLWLIALGGWMQLINLEMFGLTWSNSWPLLLIVFGLGTIARAVFDVVLAREENHGG